MAFLGFVVALKRAILFPNRPRRPLKNPAFHAGLVEDSDLAIRRNGRWTVTRLASGDWHPEEIKAAVRMLGSTLYDLARQAGLPEYACRNALRRPYYDGETAIARFLSLNPHQIWPSRYREDGGRIPAVRNRRRNITTVADSGHRQNSEAA